MTTLRAHLQRIRAIKSEARAEASRKNGRMAAGKMTKAQRVARAKKANKAWQKLNQERKAQ